MAGFRRCKFLPLHSQSRFAAVRVGPQTSHPHKFFLYLHRLARRRLASLAVTRCRKRSEEHTSELQSLMRISYAVFCLKKKTKHTQLTQLNSIDETIQLQIKYTKTHNTTS